MEVLDVLGIILSFVGSLIIAFSVIENPGEAYQDTEKYGQVKLASILISRFRCGIGLLILGF